MKPRTLDHVALYAADRPAQARYLCEHLDVRVLEETERFTLLGPSGTAGKITLFDPPSAQAPVPGQLVSITLFDDEEGRAPLVCPDNLTITFTNHPSVPPGTPRHALVGVTLRSADPPLAAAHYEREFGLDLVGVHRDVATLHVGESGIVTLVRERVGATGQPMLFHLGLLVDSATDHLEQARERGIDVVNVVDATNTLAVFLNGPDAVCLEYVEHKPTFAIA